MAQNDFLIGLVSGLDPTKSKSQINSDIENLKKSLDDVELKAKLDPQQVSNIKDQLEKLQINLNDVKFSQTALNGLVTQINDALKGIQIPNINIGGNGTGSGNALRNNTARLEEFRKSLSNIGMTSGDIDAVAQRIENLDVQITSLNQSLSHTSGAKGDRNLLNIEVGGIDKFGQAVTLTQTWDMDLRQLVKDVDAVSSATQKAGSSANTFAKHQSQAVANLTNQINQLNRYANDQNASRPISDTTHLNSLSTAYNDIIDAIQRMGSASQSTFTDEQNAVKALISNFKSLVSEYRNAENVSIKMKGTDFSSGLSIAKNDLEKFKAEAKDFPQITSTIQKLDTAIANIGDAASLNNFTNQLKIARSELAKTKAEISADNRNEKVGINTSGLQSQIADLQRISPEINNFETEINGVKVTVQSLLTDLTNINTQSDFSVVNKKFDAFTKAAKAAGIAVTEIKAKSVSVTDIFKDIDIGTYDRQFSNLEESFRKLGLSSDEIRSKTKDVSDALEQLKKKDINTAIQDQKTFADALKKSQNEASILKTNLDQIYNPKKQAKLSLDIQNWLSKNSAASKEAKQELDAYYRELSNGRVSVDRLEYIHQQLMRVESEQRIIGKLGKNLKDQWAQAAQSFTSWISVSSAIMGTVYKTKQAVTELKNVNTYLTEISKANDKLSKSELAKIGSDSFSVASKYGKSSTDYLSGVQEASRAGYKNAEGIAELSVAAQGAGDMTADLANKMIIATDKAYKMNGSISDLTAVLDGMNYITNNNAVNMTELSDGMSIVGSTAASFGVDVNELAAALGTMAATTKQSGSEVARAFKAILLNIRQVSDADEEIDAEGLTKYEKACNALGVSLKETKNGIQQLRDPMKVLEELSIAYNKLDETDIKRTNLLNAVGSKLRSTQLDALLRQWSMYEEMLKQYENGTGSMAREAEKTANSWEGSMKRVYNTWTSTVNNIANSDAIIAAINGFNNLLTAVNETTKALGSFGTVSTVAGGILGAKGLGLTNYVTTS